MNRPISSARRWQATPVRLAALLLACGVIGARPLPSQVRGVVLDADSIPIAGAVVEIWRVDQRIGGATANSMGRFVLPSMPAYPVYLTARQIGYRPRTLRLDSAAKAPLAVILRRAPVVLEEVGVTGRVLCPSPGSSAARRLIERALAPYAVPVPRMEARARLFQGETRRTAPRIAWMSMDEMVEGEIGFTSIQVASESRRRQREGYIAPDQSGAPGGAAGLAAFWGIEDSPQLLASTGFLEGHSFTLLSDDEADVVIGFCSRDRTRPFIDGLMVVDRAGFVTYVQWRFGRSSALRQAGGEVVLAPRDGEASRSLLLPLASRSWWRLPGGRYAERTRVYKEWRVYSR